MYVERLEQVAREALLGGYGTLLRHRYVRLTLGMDCEQPYVHTLFSRYSAKHGKRVQPFTVEVEARCRKCFSCKRRRSMYWTARALSEWQRWPRTVFGTVTMSPEEHAMLDAKATLRLAKGRVGFADLSPRELFAERAKEFGAEVTKYLKRLRKGDPSHDRPKLRYLLVAEVHDSDETAVEMRHRPHFHLLIHELEPGVLVHGNPASVIESGERDGEWIRKFRKDRRGRWQPIAVVADDAFLRQNWTLGFTNFQWASSAQQASYVCKYLNKSLMLRVRASQHYGDEAVLFEQGGHGQPHRKNPVGVAGPDGPSVEDDPLDPLEGRGTGGTVGSPMPGEREARGALAPPLPLDSGLNVEKE